MRIINCPETMQDLALQWHQQGLKIGLVPTMGYLHEGHISLIEAAKMECDKVIISIFVNPTQFAPNEDFAAYPRSLARDAKAAHEAGADCIFAPSDQSMYPENYSCFVEVENLSQVLCGKTRPIHFRGVATVVLKLLNIVQPHKAFFGQKDAQQFIILQQMVKDFNLQVEMRRMPIIREEDGLAKSSRNIYLSEKEREEALVLSQALQEAQNLYQAGEENAANIKSAMENILQKATCGKIDYLEMVDTEKLQPLKELKPPFMIALAVYIGKTRLIDNIIIEN
ncbi:MAG: pantoate--beta-alanine ligase [Clostridiales bacterium]